MELSKLIPIERGPLTSTIHPLKENLNGMKPKRVDTSDVEGHPIVLVMSTEFGAEAVPDRYKFSIPVRLAPLFHHLEFLDEAFPLGFEFGYNDFTIPRFSQIESESQKIKCPLFRSSSKFVFIERNCFRLVLVEF